MGANLFPWPFLRTNLFSIFGEESLSICKWFEARVIFVCLFFTVFSWPFLWTYEFLTSLIPIPFFVISGSRFESFLMSTVRSPVSTGAKSELFSPSIRPLFMFICSWAGGEPGSRLVDGPSH